MIERLIGLSHWQIDLLVISLFIEGAFFTVFPEEVVLPTLGVLWGQGKIGFQEAFLAALIGLTCGDLILVMLGRFLGMAILSRRPFSWAIDADTIKDAMERMRIIGARLVFLVRFTPTLRAPVFFSAGISKMPVQRFLRSDATGLLIWIPLLMVLGRRLGGTGSIEHAFQRIGFMMLAVVGITIGVSIYRRKKRPRVAVKPAG